MKSSDATPTVKVGDTIRRVEPWAYQLGVGWLYRKRLIETPEAAAHATKLVAEGTWIVLSTTNERKDET